ncbi:hypothetical protein HYH03_002054 [Edaphochlamys debaryana]|uniref:Uncharacterized protein n=1 Tax=Edaphochlamys debaryana TaxID=47281 RepID=A0A835YEV7_9CHLO|nr:hypothetical protein HYH03_002054 [Edaphochlamys debaryana]|eukprot:KAG2500489.1 hypothetical protein HYH03_002054 [Edaphochlamys debaryana]
MQGERILKVSLAFLDIPKNSFRRNTVTLGSLCLVTTYGGVLQSGKASCKTALPVREPNSGILAGIGGSTRLDDTGIEYVSSLFFIFHPWPEKIQFALNTYKFLGKKPQQSISVQDELAETDTRMTCTMTVERSETFSVTSSDTMSRSFGVASSKSLSQALTKGKETGLTTQVGLTKSATTGQVTGVNLGQTTQQGVEVSEGITVTKEDTSSVDITDGLSTSSHWSDSVSAGTTMSFARSDSRETSNSRELTNTQELSRGRTLSQSSTTGTSDTISSEIANSQAFEQSATRSNEVTNIQENSVTNGHTSSTSDTRSTSSTTSNTVGTSATGGYASPLGGPSFSMTASYERTWSDTVENSRTTGSESSTSLSNSQSNAHSQGMQESQGTTRGVTSTQGQARTSSRERTVGNKASTSFSQSNALSQGWSETFGSTITQEESFSSERTSERGGSVEQSRSVGYGSSSSLSNALDRSQSRSLVSTREVSESAQRSKEISDSVEKSTGTTDTLFHQAMEESAASQELNINSGTEGYTRSVDYNPDKYNVRMWLNFEEYKDMPYRAMALIYTRGLGGTIPVPVSGLLSGRFASATSYVDNTLEIDCGGPKPEVITNTVVLLNESMRKWILVLNPTSFRHAYDYCNDLGGNLISLNSAAKTSQLLQLLHYEYSDKPSLADCFKCTSPGVVKDIDQNGGNDACVCRQGTFGDPTKAIGCVPCTGKYYADAEGLSACKLCNGIAGNSSMVGPWYLDDGNAGNVICIPYSPPPKPPKPPSPPRPKPPSPRTTTAVTAAAAVEVDVTPLSSASTSTSSTVATLGPTAPLLPANFSRSSRLPPLLFNANCSVLFATLSSLRNRTTGACGVLTAANRAVALLAKPTEANCPANTSVYACVAEAAPYVTRLAEKRCCAELARVTELFRPPAAACVVSNKAGSQEDRSSARGSSDAPQSCYKV